MEHKFSQRPKWFRARHPEIVGGSEKGSDAQPPTWYKRHALSYLPVLPVLDGGERAVVATAGVLKAEW